MRIGFGFDAHELVENRPLKLGGTIIEYSLGLRGHSDGDVVLHAISDALLGACAAGDIGTHFSDKARKTENMDSREILKFALEMLERKHLKIVNIDIVIIADNPKLSPHYGTIRESISRDCGVSTEQVSVKSKTTEGTVVAKTAIACFAVALLENK